MQDERGCGPQSDDEYVDSVADLADLQERSDPLIGLIHKLLRTPSGVEVGGQQSRTGWVPQLTHDQWELGVGLMFHSSRSKHM